MQPVFFLVTPRTCAVTQSAELLTAPARNPPLTGRALSKLSLVSLLLHLQKDKVKLVGDL